MDWFEEEGHNASWGQRFKVDEVLFRAKTDHQDLVIFKNEGFGRVLALDGIVQTTERDEFIYHETLVHTPVLAHGRARSLLIIGGGDGGTAREALKHGSLERIVQVEIDPSVIELCREHLPAHNGGAYDNPRLEVVFGDGAAWVGNTSERFDVIVVDGTDPVGPGAALYTPAFYEACRETLTESGIFVAQGGNPLDELHEQAEEIARLRGIFEDAAFFSATIPTYMGGPMLFAFASRDPARRTAAVDPASIPSGLRHYTADVHRASFAIPPWFLERKKGLRY